MTLRELGEFGFIDRIRRQISELPEGILGIGDDCAGAPIPDGEVLLTSTDMLLENIHFRLDWTDLHSLGRKTVAVNLSDLAAMGATPRYLFLSLALPEDFDLELADRLMAGILHETALHGALLLGGDTCRSPGPLVLNICAQGSAPVAEVLRRDTARPGEDLYVSGTLGDSALALQLLEAGESPPKILADRHFLPTPRVTLGRRLAAEGLAGAMIDLSDGLASDLGHILKASQLGARIEAARLPLSEELRRRVRDEAAQQRLALRGGEDYELLFSARPEDREAIASLAGELGVSLTRVGELTGEPGALLRTGDGESTPLDAGGFNHFSAVPS